MYQTPLPPWPDAESVLSEDGFTVSAEHLRRLGRGDIKAGVRQLRLILAAETERKPIRGPAEKPATVRLGTEADETAILDLLLLDVVENAAHIAPASPEQILAQIQIGTRQKGGFVGVIDGEDGAPIAVCILHPCQWWWSDQIYLGDVVNYIHPDHRHSRHVDDLLEFEMWAADAMTAQYGHRVYLQCGVLGTKRLHAKLMLFWRRFTEVGRAYLYPAPEDA